MEEGYFQEAGLDVEVVTFARAGEALPALAQGQLDVAAINVGSAALNVMAREAQIRVVASLSQGHEDGCVFHA